MLFGLLWTSFPVIGQPEVQLLSKSLFEFAEYKLITMTSGKKRGEGRYFLPDMSASVI